MKMKFIWNKVGIDYISSNVKLMMIKMNLSTYDYELYDVSVYNNYIGTFRDANSCMKIAECMC